MVGLDISDYLNIPDSFVMVGLDICDYLNIPDLCK